VTTAFFRVLAADLKLIAFKIQKSHRLTNGQKVSAVFLFLGIHVSITKIHEKHNFRPVQSSFGENMGCKVGTKKLYLIICGWGHFLILKTSLRSTKLTFQM
jgi:hypothetical protein